MNKVQTWRLALAEAANFSGWDCLGTRNESELVEQIAMDILQKLDSITSGGLERRINTYKQIAQQKLEKSLRTDDSSDWSDVLATYQRIMQLKQDKWMRTLNTKDLEDLKAASNHVLYIQREQSNRSMGFRGI
ncbi:hypothetical protein P8452_70151 [Trifolium repens]|nr:hypothetical protein P8452_70151 [Trifolium repens]